MASTTQDRLYETFVAVSGQQDSKPDGSLDSGEEIAASLSDTVKQLGELLGGNAAQASGSESASTASTTGSGNSASAQETNSGATSNAGTTSGSNSGATSGTTSSSNSAFTEGTTSSSNSASTAGTTGGGGSTLESIATTVLESGLGMVPLIVGLMGLFGGGGTPAPPALVKYAMPERQYFEGADTGSDVGGADYDQMGMPRTYGAAPDGTSAQASGTAVPGSSSGGATSGSAAPQITVNVQAMDSQSFLDHSSEIAQAVRAAMLNSNSINDVVNDL